MLLHRHVVEQREGRTLGRDEIVHHIDHDPFNNDPDNLVVLTRSEHMRIHMLSDRPRRWTVEEQTRALELADAGMTIDPISRIVGRSYAGTRDQLIKLRRKRSSQTIDEEKEAA